MDDATKPKPHYQGKCIVERDGPVLLVLTPDGNVSPAKNESVALRKCRAYFKKYNPTGFGVGEIEWRRCQPPTGAR